MKPSPNSCHIYTHAKKKVSNSYLEFQFNLMPCLLSGYLSTPCFPGAGNIPSLLWTATPLSSPLKAPVSPAVSHLCGDRLYHLLSSPLSALTSSLPWFVSVSLHHGAENWLLVGLLLYLLGSTGCLYGLWGKFFKATGFYWSQNSPPPKAVFPRTLSGLLSAPISRSKSLFCWIRAMLA